MKAVERVILLAKSYVGYTEKASNKHLDEYQENKGHNNYQKFGRDLYKAGFFNGNKNGYDWCTQFVVGINYYITRSRELTEKVLCFDGPYAAGCNFASRYYMNHNRFYTSNPQPGDQIFFNDFSHTGLVEKVSGNYVYTIEGNSCDKVEAKRYNINSSMIDGYGRPQYELIPDSNETFVDVLPEDWFYDAVQWAEKNHIASGVSKAVFAPTMVCTRGQAMTFLWNTMGKPEPNGRMNFRDVSSVDYYYKPIQWAVGEDITAGVDTNHFAPDNACTRGQFVTFLWRANGQPKVDATNHFVDVAKDDYFYDAVMWAVENKIVSGVDSRHFNPDDYCNRGMAVTMLYQMR